MDRVREDIHEHKKLNIHLYNCLKKSLYKPAAFFKGFLFPLAQACFLSLLAP
jgi:essential nuclear protein 1